MHRFFDIWWKPIRDVLLFFSGLAGVAHQTLIVAEPKESLLILFAGMMGLPFIFPQQRPANGNEAESWRKQSIRDVFPEEGKRPPWMKMKVLTAYPLIWIAIWVMVALRVPW